MTFINTLPYIHIQKERDIEQTPLRQAHYNPVRGKKTAAGRINCKIVNVKGKEWEASANPETELVQALEFIQPPMSLSSQRAVLFSSLKSFLTFSPGTAAVLSASAVRETGCQRIIKSLGVCSLLSPFSLAPASACPCVVVVLIINAHILHTLLLKFLFTFYMLNTIFSPSLLYNNTTYSLKVKAVLEKSVRFEQKNVFYHGSVFGSYLLFIYAVSDSLAPVGVDGMVRHCPKAIPPPKELGRTGCKKRAKPAPARTARLRLYGKSTG